MLKDKDAVATVAVKDLRTAARFYGETLGLPRGRSDDEEVITFQCGKTLLFVYRSQFAGTNEATSVSFMVGDEIEEIVRTLKARGVTFEHYDLPGMKREGDLHFGGKMKAAWLKDPEGNILALLSG